MNSSSHGNEGLTSIPESETASNDDVISKHQSLPVSSSRKANLSAPLPPAPRKETCHCVVHCLFTLFVP